MYLTKEQIMAKFGITSWPAMTFQQYLEVGKSLDIDIRTKYWILEQSPFYVLPVDEETVVVLDTIRKQNAELKVHQARWEIVNLIQEMK